MPNEVITQIFSEEDIKKLTPWVSLVTTHRVGSTIRPYNSLFLGQSTRGYEFARRQEIDIRDTLGDVLLIAVPGSKLYFNHEDQGPDNRKAGIVRYRDIGKYDIWKESIVPSEARFEKFDLALTKSGLIADERIRAAIESKR